MNELFNTVSTSLISLLRYYKQFLIDPSFSAQLYQTSHELDSLVNSNTNSFQIINNILSTSFFQSSSKAEQQLFLILLIHYYEIHIQCHSPADAICPIEILHHFAVLLSDEHFYQSDPYFYKFISSFVGKIIDSSQLSLLTNHLPNIGFFLVFKTFTEKIKNMIGTLSDADEICQYIISNSFFVPKEGALDFSIISCSILSMYDIYDDNFYKLMLPLFNISISPPLFSLFYELIPIFNKLPDGKDKYSLSFHKLTELAPFYLNSNQFEYPLLHNNETLDLGDIALPFLDYIDYHLNRYEDDDDCVDIDKYDFVKVAFVYSIITMQNRRNWNTLDDFFNECCRNPDDMDEINSVNKALTMIITTITLPELNAFMNQMLQDNAFNNIDPSLFQEAYYRISFSYLIADQSYGSFQLIPPLKDDPLLIGEYLRCFHMLKGQLDLGQYEILFAKSNYIINILIGQGLALSIREYPPELLSLAYEMLFPLVDQFSTGISSEFCAILGQIIMKTGDFIDPLRFLLPLKEKWESCVIDPTLDFNIYQIISDFSNQLSIIPRLLNIFLPLLGNLLTENTFNTRALEMLSILIHRLPQPDLEIGADNEQLLARIYQNFFQTLDALIDIWYQDHFIKLETIHLIAAFYCRIHLTNESFGHYLIRSISLFHEYMFTCQKHYFSFLYEYLSQNSPDSIRIIQAILDYLHFVKEQGKADQKRFHSHFQLLTLAIATYCTSDLEVAPKFILNNIPNFPDVFFPLIFHYNEINEFLLYIPHDEQHIFIIMFIAFVKIHPTLLVPSCIRIIDDVFKQIFSPENQSTFLNGDDPSIQSHPCVNLNRVELIEIICQHLGPTFEPNFSRPIQ